jgi:hypothetical protein
VSRVRAASTIEVEFDRELLERLRRRRPDKSDRELLESAARIQLGREASGRARESFAGVSSEEIEREAVKLPGKFARSAPAVKGRFALQAGRSSKAST